MKKKLFYKIDPEKIFAFVARSTTPARLKEGLVLKTQDEDPDLRYYWSIDLLLVPDSPLFTSTFCMQDEKGIYKPQQISKNFDTREKALAFISKPSLIFEPARISCFVFNGSAPNWETVYAKILEWAQLNDKEHREDL